MKMTKEAKVAIQNFINSNKEEYSLEEIKSQLVSRHQQTNWEQNFNDSFQALSKISTFELMEYLVNEYKPEKTPEDSLRKKFLHHLENVIFYKNKKLDHNELMQESFSRGFTHGVVTTIDTFEIQSDIHKSKVNGYTYTGSR